MKKFVLHPYLAFTLFVTTLLLVFPTPIHALTEARGGGSCGDTEIYSAIGCIPVGDETSFGEFFIRWGLGIGGGIAFLLIVYAGFIIITSSGNPQRLQSGKELLTAALSGLLLFVFSVFILRLLGQDILRIF